MNEQQSVSVFLCFYGSEKLYLKKKRKGLVVFCLSLSKTVISLVKLQCHVHVFYYYPTARSRAQLMHETRTNIYRFFFTVKNNHLSKSSVILRRKRGTARSLCSCYLYQE